MERLICGFGGRTKASRWELLVGRFLIHQKELELSHNLMSYLRSTNWGFIIHWVRQVTSKIVQAPRSILMVVKSPSFLAFCSGLAWSNVSCLVQAQVDFTVCMWDINAKSRSWRGRAAWAFGRAGRRILNMQSVPLRSWISKHTRPSWPLRHTAV